MRPSRPAPPWPPWRRTLAVALLAAATAACSAAPGVARDGAATPSRAAGAPGTPSDAPSDAPTLRPSGPFTSGHVTLRPSDGPPATVAVHVAADPRARRRGLMHREDVPRGTGMLFTWPEDNRGAFWMKDTLVPLSIAFADAEGTILRILDMEPCLADPCRRYDPQVAYRYALEVAQGDFERLGVGEGDTLVVPGSLRP